MQESKNRAVNFSLIVAHDHLLGIGKLGQLPWHLPQDLKRFKEITTTVHDPSLKNAVVMGRKTWQSIPANQRPLSKRYNIILTRNQSFKPEEFDSKKEEVVVLPSLEAAIGKVRELPCESCFVIGGAEVFERAIALPEFKRVYATEVMGTYDCDVKIPEYRHTFLLVEQSGWLHNESDNFRFCLYERK
jgi:dihydrofolate reductase / thymidylate synthase